MSKAGLTVVALSIGIGMSMFVFPLTYTIPVTIVVLVVVTIILAEKKNQKSDFFSPYRFFPTLWIITVAIGSIQISPQQSPWSLFVWTCFIAALISYLAGVYFIDFRMGGLGKKIVPEQIDFSSLKNRWSRSNFNFLITTWFLIAISFEYYEFKIIGGIPLFSQEWETIRLTTAGTSYLLRFVHMFAYSFMLIAMVLQVKIFSEEKIFCGKNTFYIFLLLLSLFCSALWGSRHTLVIPLMVGAVLYHYMRKRFTIGRIVVLGLLLTLFLSVVSFYRTTTIWREKDVDYSDVLEGTEGLGYGNANVFVAQAHNQIAINFEMFRRLVETFPSQMSFQHGRYTFFAFYSLLPGHEPSLGELQNDIWGTRFYGNLTATFLSAPYVDFGLLGIILFSFLVGMIMKLSYNSMLIRPTNLSVLLYSYMNYHILFMPYDHTLNKLNLLIDLFFLITFSYLARERGFER